MMASLRYSRWHILYVGSLCSSSRPCTAIPILFLYSLTNHQLQLEPKAHSIILRRLAMLHPIKKNPKCVIRGIYEEIKVLKKSQYKGSLRMCNSHQPHNKTRRMLGITCSSLVYNLQWMPKLPGIMPMMMLDTALIKVSIFIMVVRHLKVSV